MDGFGILYFQNGNIAFKGEFKENNFHGHGILYNAEISQLFDNFDFTNFNLLNN